ncbi:hypothetical protein L1987_32223 [Smallanthus sonchifolius]|uniref:Uncharacterized protein n=1 Tax=Smallanthus sonchifolius TaxID=185202 RepID=A0ACB9I973_9ASTR|nr:hypothetical protein L1987_32223 [Smallanthus sonchifolius]
MSILGFVNRKGRGVKPTSRPLLDLEDEVLARTRGIVCDPPASSKAGEDDIDAEINREGVMKMLIGSDDEVVEEALKEDDGGQSLSVRIDESSKVNSSEIDKSVSARTEGFRPDVIDQKSCRNTSPSGAASDGINQKTIPRQKRVSRRDSSSGKSKATIIFFDSELSLENESGNFDPNEDYIPNWGVKKGDTLDDLEVCHRILHHSTPRGEACLDHEMKGMHVSDRAGCMAVKTMSAVSDLVIQYERKVVREARLRDRIKRYRVRMTEQSHKIFKLKKHLKKLGGGDSYGKKYKKVIKDLEEKDAQNLRVIEALRKDLKESQDSQDSVTRSYLESTNRAHILSLQVSELESSVQELTTRETLWEESKGLYDKALVEADKIHAELKKMVEVASSDWDWLSSSQGFQYVIERLHRSVEFLEPLGVMETSLWAAAPHCGVVKGYEGQFAGIRIEDIEGYDPAADGAYDDAAKAWQHVHYTYLKLYRLARESL